MRRVLCSLLLVLALVLAAAPSALADGRVVDRISFGPASTNAVTDASFQGMSRDGNCVAFSTGEAVRSDVPAAAGNVYESCGAGFLGFVGAGTVAAMNENGSCILFADGRKLCGSTASTVTAGRPRALSRVGDCAIVTDGGTIRRDCDGTVSDVASGAAYGGTSADGGCVAYSTTAKAASTDLDSSRDVYVRCGSSDPQQESLTAHHLPAVSGDNPKPVRDPSLDAEVAGISPDGRCVVLQTREALDADGSDEGARDTGTATLWSRCGSAAPVSVMPASGVAVQAVANGGCFAFTTGGALRSTCLPGFSASGATFGGQADGGDGIAWGDVNGAHQLLGGDTTLVSALRSGPGPAQPATANAVSADGQTVAFTTTSSLVKDDTDALNADVYQLHPGAILFPDSADQPPAGGGGAPTSGGGGGSAGTGTGTGTGTGKATIGGLQPPGALTATTTSVFQPDDAAPRLSGLAMVPRTVPVGGSAQLQVVLDEPASVTFVVQRRFDGRRHKGRCVTKGKASKGKGRRCTVWRTQGKPVTGDVPSGLTELTFTPGTLVPANYRVVATARDGSGNVTRAVSTTFTVKPKAKPKPKRTVKR